MLLAPFTLGSAVVALVIAAAGVYVLGRTRERHAARARCAAAEAAEAAAVRCLEAMARERSELESRHRAQVAALREDLRGGEARLAEAGARFQRLRTQARQADVRAAQERRQDEAALQARDREILAALVERQRLQEALAQVVAARMEQEQRHAMLLAASRQVRTCDDPDALRSEAVGLAARQLHVTLWGLFEVERTGEVLRPVAGAGWKEGRLERATLAARGGGLGAYVLASAAPIVVDELLDDTRFLAPPLLVEHGVVSALLVPVAGARGATGLMGFFSTQPRLFCSGDASFAAGVAALLELMGERARASDAVRDERARATAVEGASLDAVLLLDDFGRVASANEAAGAMFRCRAESLRTRGVGDLLWAGAERELDVARAVQQSLRDREGIQGCATGRRSDGSAFCAQVAIASAGAQQGPRLVVVIRDLGAVGRGVWAPPPARATRFTLLRSGAPLAAKQVAIAAPRRANVALAGPSGAGVAAP
ncbi:MAG TPA: GAF domain-containing protein [Gemmatimonadales bacterium]|nr:GAF domain-containing protein [Gemmatimonadales bacterium]